MHTASNGAGGQEQYVICHTASASNMETEAERIKGRVGGTYQYRSIEILVLRSVSEINDYCAIHHFFFDFHSVLLCEMYTSVKKPF